MALANSQGDVSLGFVTIRLGSEYDSVLVNVPKFINGENYSSTDI